MKNILFVCSGNTCRSPLAQAIAQRVFSSRPARGWLVSSAGSSATEGLPASEHSLEIARNHGFDLTAHRSRPLSSEMAEQTDLIVAMGAGHRSHVGMIDGDALEHTYLLTDFCEDLDGDVPDPIGGDLETYERVYEMIHRCVEGLADALDDFGGWKTPAGKETE